MRSWAWIVDKRREAVIPTRPKESVEDTEECHRRPVHAKCRVRDQIAAARHRAMDKMDERKRAKHRQHMIIIESRV